MKFPLIEIYWLKLHQHACESFYWLIRIRLRRKLPINSVGPENHLLWCCNAVVQQSWSQLHYCQPFNLS